MSDEDQLARLERALNATLALQIDAHIRAFPALGKPRPRIIETVLDDLGYSSSEIGQLLGKSRQAVEKRLGKSLTTSAD